MRRLAIYRSPLRAWQEAATILVGSHFLLPLLAYYSLKLFFPVVIAGMANTGVAPGQTRPSTAGVLRERRADAAGHLVVESGGSSTLGRPDASSGGHGTTMRCWGGARGCAGAT